MRLDENKANTNALEKLKVSLEYEIQIFLEVESILSQLKSENIDGWKLAILDELQGHHVMKLRSFSTQCVQECIIACINV